MANNAYLDTNAPQGQSGVHFGRWGALHRLIIGYRLIKLENDNVVLREEFSLDNIGTIEAPICKFTYLFDKVPSVECVLVSLTKLGRRDFQAVIISAVDTSHIQNSGFLVY